MSSFTPTKGELEENGVPPHCSGFKFRQPPQRAQPRQEAILATPCGNKSSQTLQTPGKRTPRKAECSIAIVRSGDGVFHGASSEERAIIHPLRLNELELPPEMRSDEGEH